MGYMYILKCSDGTYYTGSTVDLEKRLWQHQRGEGANYTKKRLPVELIYYEDILVLKKLFTEKNKCRAGAERKRKL